MNTTVYADGEFESFEWSQEKASLNFQKHGVTFEEAITCFGDKWAIREEDIDHSWEEERLKLTGFSNKANLLLVCHCYKETGKYEFSTRIRIISARKATIEEEKAYEKNRKNF